MGNEGIPEERRVFIDFMVDYLQDKYSDGKHIDFEAVIRDFGIIIPDIDYILYFWELRRDVPYLCGPKKAIPCVKRFCQAHELGHIFLHSGKEEFSVDQKEQEADYFAMNLGINPGTGFLLPLDLVLVMWRNRHNFFNYVRKMDKKTLIKVTIDRCALETLLVPLLTSEEFYQS